MDLKEAKHRAAVRLLAKEFKSRIANGMCLRVPDDIIDRIDDKDIALFKELCNTVGLKMITEPATHYGYWEKR